MRIYFAPMEGLTDAAFRQLHHKYFPGIDRYYMPFISPTIHRSLTPREARELPPADSSGFTAIPQVLGKVVEDLAWAVEQCKNLGYREVNLNLGCPSGTVVAKGKGAGMLSNPDNLDRFLEELYSKAVLPISIKTRLGMTDPEEFPRLLQIYNQYPVRELIVHPRVRKVFYAGQCDMDMFRYAVANSRAPVCYNGNLNSKSDVDRIAREFPSIDSVMVGRALIANPGMFSPDGTTKDTLKAFLDELFETYCVLFGSRRNAMFRMKENWHFLLSLFEGSEKLGKQLRKTTDYDTFRSITHQIIDTLPIRTQIEADW